METNEASTSFGGFYQRERGAGGKFRKPNVRKLPSTPYDRPATHTTRQRGEGEGEGEVGGWWFSKLVDPATRLISGGATKLFPSFFSKPSSDVQHLEVKRDAGNEEPEQISNIEIPRSTEGGQGPKEADRSKCCSDLYEHAGNKLGNSSDGRGLFEIEQMMKEKTFSRDDLNHLTEILHSRIADLSDADEQGKGTPNVSIGVEPTDGSLGRNNLNIVEGKQPMYFDRITGDISNSFLQATTQNQVEASPVEIAKAYMGARPLDVGVGSQSVIVRDERNPLQADGFSSKSYISSPSPKSSICWPGAMVHEQHAYLTPQTQRGRVGLHNLPRTPYSRGIHSRSTSKLQGSGDRSLNISTHSKILQTPVYGDSQVISHASDPHVMRSSISSYGDGFGSVGPIRRMRCKIGDTTPFKGTDSSHPVNSGPLWEEPGASTRSNIKVQTVDSRAPSSNVGISTVHPQSSEMARKILEHLDRTTPTPQKKSAELRLATSWRKTPASNFTTVMLNDRGKDIIGKVSSKQRETADANIDTSACKAFFSLAGSGHDGVGFNARSSIDFKKTHNSLLNTNEAPVGLDQSLQSEKNQSLSLHSRNDGLDVSRFGHSGARFDAINLQKKPPRQIFGSKPALAHISIAKPHSRRNVPLDNGSGFTFPVSASSGVLSEPPTPSVMPSQEKTTVPLYSFGSNADRTLVFSFPSTSSSTPADGSTPKFNFGSRKARISFSLVGKDAICF